MTMEPIRSGWPYTAPSRCARQATLSGPAAATPAATPVRAASRPYIGHAAAGPLADPGPSVTPGLSGCAVLVAGLPGAAPDPGADPEPLHAAAPIRTPSTAPAKAVPLCMPPVWRIPEGAGGWPPWLLLRGCQGGRPPWL